ncbi:MAG: hypothetical protein Q9227_002436 [Pyrenula ochraceoflavens]
MTTSLVSGGLFGSALLISQVYHPSVIIAQLQLRSFRMLSVFLTAAASSAVVQFTFQKTGTAQPSVRSNSTLGWFSLYDGNIIGGAAVGAGMALTGACPGTVIVQLGTGVASSQAVAAGAVLGGMAYARFGKQLVTNKYAHYNPRKDTVSDVLHTKPIAMLLAFEAASFLAVTLFTYCDPNLSYELNWDHPIVGGLLIGLAQASSILISGTTLGVSTAYEHLGRYILRPLVGTSMDVPRWPSRSLVFALGILLASGVLGSVLPNTESNDFVDISLWKTVLGGFLLALGARTAGGCTSGHGISGLSAFSASSFITVAAMFAVGIGMSVILSGLNMMEEPWTSCQRMA